MNYFIPKTIKKKISNMLLLIRNISIIIIVFSVVLYTDRISKQWVIDRFSNKADFFLQDETIVLTYKNNSIFIENIYKENIDLFNFYVYLILMLIIFFKIFLTINKIKFIEILGLTIILSSLISNFADFIFYNNIVNWISIKTNLYSERLPNFNFSDVYMVLGILILLGYSILSMRSK